MSLMIVSTHTTPFFEAQGLLPCVTSRSMALQDTPSKSYCDNKALGEKKSVQKVCKVQRAP